HPCCDEHNKQQVPAEARLAKQMKRQAVRLHRRLGERRAHEPVLELERGGARAVERMTPERFPGLGPPGGAVRGVDAPEAVRALTELVLRACELVDELRGSARMDGEDHGGRRGRESTERRRAVEDATGGDDVAR